MKRHQRRMQTLSTTQGRRIRRQRIGSPHRGRSEVAVEGGVEAARGGRPPNTVLTVVPVPAGALGWLVTHNVVITLGLALIVGLVVTCVVWHIVREETRQVELREKGATDRLQICHHSERVLAETHRSVYMATVCGPSAWAADARAVREDARQAARELRQSTSLEEAMRITRAQGPDAAEDRDDGPGSAGPLTAA